MSFVRCIINLIAFLQVANATGLSSTNEQANLFTTNSRITNGLSSSQTDQNSKNISMSDDGRYIVFESASSNIVSGDINALKDVFLFDSNTSTYTILSVGLSASQSNGESFDPMISGDGAYIVFASNATNLVASDTNATTDIFLVVRSSGVISRLSIATAGTQSNGPSGDPSISGNGNLITFSSDATNLVASDTNAKRDVFLRSVSGVTTTRISISTASAQADDDSYEGRISADGTLIAFTSDATNLIGSDANACSDVLLRNISGATTSGISTSSGGTLGNRTSFRPTISSDGTYVAFQSRAGNLVASDTNHYTDIFLKNTSSGATTLISRTSYGVQVSYDSSTPSISSDGRFVVFESRSPDYSASDTNSASDVFIYDRLSSTTRPYSVEGASTIGNAKSVGAKISGDGTKIGFESLSTNLVTPDTNAKSDLFTRTNPLAGQLVDIVPIGNVTENGGSQNAYTVTRYGSTASSLTVYYTVTGAATAGTDYTTLSGSVTISSSASTATIPIVPTNDSTVEADESVIVTLSTDAAYEIGGRNSATSLITNDDVFTVTVTATANTATEDSIKRGSLRVERTVGGTYGDLIVNMTASGTATAGSDYLTLPSSVVIPAGQAYVDTEVVGMEDTTSESAETIVWTIASGTGYTAGSPDHDTVTISDNDTFIVSVNATDVILDESNVSDTGTIRIDRGTATSQSLVVKYVLKGTAQNGVDYTTLSGSATIASGQSYIDVTVTPTSDADVEGYESIIVDLLPGDLYSIGQSSSAMLVIKEDTDLPVVSIEATDSVATEDGSNTGNFRISRTGSTSSGLTVTYNIGGTAVNGTDYSSLSGSATIAMGNSYVDVTVTGTGDSTVESTETVIAAIQSSSDYFVDIVYSQGQVNILDDETPTVQVFREAAYSHETGSKTANVRVSRTGNLSSSLTVNLTYSGSATNGTDYTNPGSSVVIAASESSKSFSVTATSDSGLEGNEIAKIMIASGSYTIGDASFTEVVVVDSPYEMMDKLSLDPDADLKEISVSDDGRYIVFSSAATNLVSGDTNGVSDIFIIDTTGNSISRILAPGSVQLNGASISPMVSADGSYVVFSSVAKNLHANDLNNYYDVYLYTISGGAIAYVSKGYTNVSEGGDSLNPYITANGEYIVFESRANNLVLSDTNSAADIFHYTRASGALERVSLKASNAQFTNGSYRPSVSADGNLVVFESIEAISSDSDSYLDVLLRNRSAGTITRVSAPYSGTANTGGSNLASISQDGKIIAYQSISSNIVSNDTNASVDIFKYTVSGGTNEIASKSVDGTIGDKASIYPTLDYWGEQVLFISNSRNFGGDFNCTTSAYVKAPLRKTILPIENGSMNSCSAPVKEAYLSSSGKFVVSTPASSEGFREIYISPSNLQRGVF